MNEGDSVNHRASHWYEAIFDIRVRENEHDDDDHHPVLQRLPRDIDILFRIAGQAPLALPPFAQIIADAHGMPDITFPCQHATQLLKDHTTAAELKSRLEPLRKWTNEARSGNVSLLGAQCLLMAYLLKNVLSAVALLQQSYFEDDRSKLFEFFGEAVAFFVHRSLYTEIATLRQGFAETAKVKSLDLYTDRKPTTADIEILQEEVPKKADELDDSLNYQIISMALSFLQMTALVAAYGPSR